MEVARIVGQTTDSPPAVFCVCMVTQGKVAIRHRLRTVIDPAKGWRHLGFPNSTQAGAWPNGVPVARSNKIRWARRLYQWRTLAVTIRSKALLCALACFVHLQFHESYAPVLPESMLANYLHPVCVNPQHVGLVGSGTYETLLAR